MIQAVTSYQLNLGLAEYFNEAQVSRNCHPRLISSLAKLFRKSDQVAFTLEFIKLFGTVLIQNEKCQHAIKAVEFIAKFCCHLDESYGESFLTNVIEFAMQVSDRKETIVRQRVCEFVSVLLANMGAQAAIADEMFELITESMLERMKDKVTSIRSKAILALQRLQEPQEDSCPVIKTFLYHLEYDPIPEVRKKILESIAVAPKTLPSIVARSRDGCEAVRKSMYKTMSKLKFSRFRIVHRQTLLVDGLNDTSQNVQDFVKKRLVTEWFDYCSKDLLIFLEHLDVQTFNPQVLDKLLFSLFSRQPAADCLEIISNLLTPDKLIPIEKLKPESAVLWLYVVKYFHDPPENIVIDCDMVESILPTLTSLAMFVRIIGEGLKRFDTSLDFIISCLVQLAGYIEADTAGVSTMLETCRSLLLNPEVESRLLINSIAQLLEKLITDPSERSIYFAETSSDILFPLEEESCDDDIEKLDRDVLIKVMLLASDILKASDIEINSALFSFATNICVPALSHVDKQVIAKTVDVLSLACMLDVNLAQSNFIKFQILIDLDEATSAPALEAFFNQLLIHGIAPFFPQEKEEKSLEKENEFSLDLSNEPLLTFRMRKAFGRVLAKLEASDIETRSAAAQGLAKLMLSGQLRSPQVLARLIILWFSPDLGQDPWISQPLGLFFNVFAKKVSSAGDIILGTMVPLIEHVKKAPADSPSYLVDLSSICNFVTTLLQPKLIPLSTPSYQYQLAVTLIDYLLSQKNSYTSYKPVAKSFSHINIQSTDKEYVPKLIEPLNKLIKKLSQLDEKAARNAVMSFQNKIISLTSENGTSRRARSRSRTPTKTIVKQLSKVLVDTIIEESENIPETDESDVNNFVPNTPGSMCSEDDIFE